MRGRPDSTHFCYAPKGANQPRIRRIVRFRSQASNEHGVIVMRSGNQLES